MSSGLSAGGGFFRHGGRLSMGILRRGDCFDGLWINRPVSSVSFQAFPLPFHDVFDEFGMVADPVHAFMAIFFHDEILDLGRQIAEPGGIRIFPLQAVNPVVPESGSDCPPAFAVIGFGPGFLCQVSRGCGCRLCMASRIHAKQEDEKSGGE